jgi:hypothetical protein
MEREREQKVFSIALLTCFLEDDVEFCTCCIFADCRGNGKREKDISASDV